MNFLKHPLVILSFTLFSVLFSLSLYSNWKRNQATSAQVAKLESEVAEMNSEVALLEDATVAASSSGAVEKIIRDQLLMQKPGEQVLQLPPIQKTEAVAPASQTSEITPWRAWLAVFSR